MARAAITVRHLDDDVRDGVATEVESPEPARETEVPRVDFTGDEFG